MEKSQVGDKNPANKGSGSRYTRFPEGPVYLPFRPALQIPANQAASNVTTIAKGKQAAPIEPPLSSSNVTTIAKGKQAASIDPLPSSSNITTIAKGKGKQAAPIEPPPLSPSSPPPPPPESSPISSYPQFHFPIPPGGGLKGPAAECVCACAHAHATPPNGLNIRPKHEAGVGLGGINNLESLSLQSDGEEKDLEREHAIMVLRLMLYHSPLLEINTPYPYVYIDY